MNIFSGYMAPEYVRQGHFSVKSDIFSFGVLILEIITGQKNSSFQIGEADNLLSYVSRNHHNHLLSVEIIIIICCLSIPD